MSANIPYSWPSPTIALEKSMRNLIRKSVQVLLLSLFCLGALPAQTAIDRIVAVVDKEIITESELMERVSFYAFQNKMDATRPDLKRQMLESMVTEKLILAQALIDSIQVTDEEVTQTLDRQIQNLVRQAGSEKKLEEYYGKTLARIRREFREDMRKQLLVQRVRQTREGSILVTSRDVEDFYVSFKDSLPQVPEEFTLSHIYVTPKADSSIELQTRQKATIILDSIKAGGDFAEFAKRYSADGTAASGGDLGWSKRGDFVREFEEALFSLKENQLSGVVKTQYGFHIVQLLGRRGESVHARHILFRVEKGAASDSAAVKKLWVLRDSIAKGVAFGDLARRHSEDEDSRPLGGDLGDLTAEQLTSTFAEEVKDLKEGEISAPTRVVLGNGYGYQIVWMRKRILAHTPTLAGDYKHLERLALYVKRNRMNSQWLEELKKNIYMDVRL
jgi:peptidyl-prolyl cis-trans isomerase SurA